MTWIMEWISIIFSDFGIKFKECYDATVAVHGWFALIPIGGFWFAWVRHWVDAVQDRFTNFYYSVFANFRRRDPDQFFLVESILWVFLFLLTILVSTYLFVYCLHLTLPFWPGGGGDDE